MRGLLSTDSQSGAQDWKDYVFWNKNHYVRNLVDSTEEYELIVSSLSLFLACCCVLDRPADADALLCHPSLLAVLHPLLPCATGAVLAAWPNQPHPQS